MTRLIAVQLGADTTDTDCGNCPHEKNPGHCAPWCDVFDDGCGERSQACVDNEEGLATIRGAALGRYEELRTLADMRGDYKTSETYTAIIERLGL